ncbi:MAG: hypothetical protein ACKVZJ_01050 [Phycisphaerales bacterium]
MKHAIRTIGFAVAALVWGASALGQGDVGPPAEAAPPGGAGSGAKVDQPGRATVRASTLDPETNRFIVYYYLNPQPERFEEVFRKIASATGEDAGGNGPVFSAFYAPIMKANPQRIEGWVRALSTPDILPIHRRALWRAAVLSKVPEGKAALAKLLPAAPDDDRRIIQEFIDMPPADLLGELPRSTRALDMMWSSFNASGDERYVHQVINAMAHEKSEVGSDVMFAMAAGWSLQSNAWQHSKVLEICREKVKTAEGIVLQRLKDAIQGAEERLKSEPCPEPAKGT